MNGRDTSGTHEIDALVVFHGRLDHPLWDRGAGALLGEIETRLDGVFVTIATVSEDGPLLRDAIGAARFVGATSALVVVPDEIAARTIGRDAAALPYRVAVAPEWSAGGIAGLFRRECRASAQRACA